MRTVSTHLIVSMVVTSTISGCALRPDPEETLDYISQFVQPGMTRATAVERLRGAGFACGLFVGKLDCTRNIDVFPMTSCSQGATLVLNSKNETIVIAKRSPSCFGGFG